jgi:hypothetical protein
MSDYIQTIYIASISAFFGACTWVVKNLLTNKEEIRLLQAEIAARDKRREEDREILLGLKKDIEEVRSEILEIYKTK